MTALLLFLIQTALFASTQPCEQQLLARISEAFKLPDGLKPLAGKLVPYPKDSEWCKGLCRYTDLYLDLRAIRTKTQLAEIAKTLAEGRRRHEKRIVAYPDIASFCIRPFCSATSLSGKKRARTPMSRGRLNL